MDAFFCVFVALLGVTIGSFLNVCIYRIPKKISLVYPRSACPNCQHTLSFFELFPIISFLALRGKCKNCGNPISWQYPLIEALTGLLFVIAYYLFGFGLVLIKAWIFIAIAIVIALIDVEHMIIPNVITLPGIALGLILSYKMLLPSLLGAAAGFLVIAIVIVLSKGGMGWGDAKLLAMIGAFWGWKTVGYGLFAASLLGSIVGVAFLLTGKIKRKTPIPFGPFLCLGSMIVLFLPWFR